LFPSWSNQGRFGCAREMVPYFPPSVSGMGTPRMRIAKKFNDEGWDTKWPCAGAVPKLGTSLHSRAPMQSLETNLERSTRKGMDLQQRNGSWRATQSAPERKENGPCSLACSFACSLACRMAFRRGTCRTDHVQNSRHLRRTSDILRTRDGHPSPWGSRMYTLGSKREMLPQILEHLAPPRTTQILARRHPTGRSDLFDQRPTWPHWTSPPTSKRGLNHRMRQGGL